MYFFIGLPRIIKTDGKQARAQHIDFIAAAERQHQTQFYAAGPVSLAQLDANQVEIKGRRKLAALVIVEGDKHTGACTGVQGDDILVHVFQPYGGHDHDVEIAHLFRRAHKLVVAVKVAFVPEDSFEIYLAAYPDQFVDTVAVIDKEMACAEAVELLPDGEIGREGLRIGIDMRLGVGKAEGFEQGVSPADPYLVTHANFICRLRTGHERSGQNTQY